MNKRQDLAERMEVIRGQLGQLLIDVRNTEPKQDDLEALTIVDGILVNVRTWLAMGAEAMRGRP